ncbi:MAG: hypothetical protein LT106_18800 [Burkholderiaceae bacterium]|nr:hypothetical protein [Burkholderiaceae bacterium]
MARRIIRVDGNEEALPQPVSMRQILSLIGADCADTVILKHLGRPLQVMVVDDTGAVDGKPVNAKATALYHANCRPGTAHPICGDVAIVFDKDFV